VEVAYFLWPPCIQHIVFQIRETTIKCCSKIFTPFFLKLQIVAKIFCEMSKRYSAAHFISVSALYVKTVAKIIKADLSDPNYRLVLVS